MDSTKSSEYIEEKVLANSTKMCYTYDSLSRVTKRTVKNLSNTVLSEEAFSYDAAGNITDAPDSCFAYDANNRLVVFDGNSVSYDLDGNLLSNGSLTCSYDSANKLISAGGHTYTYNAEDVRIRNLCAEEDTTYTYNTNAKLSMLLMKTTGGVVTKYVYGRGLIGEEVSGAFKTYHFDCRGSTIAITDATGNITDTFAYDTYGKLISRTGNGKVIFGYNGRDGVVTDDNGLIYMRARYYSPEMKRFINADVVAGAISNAITLNRFAYANGNPVSFVDPFGLTAEDDTSFDPSWLEIFFDCASAFMEGVDRMRGAVYKYKYNSIISAKKPKRIPQGSWILKNSRKIAHLDDAIGSTSSFAKGASRVSKVIDVAGDIASAFAIAWDTGMGIAENIENGTRTQKIVSDAIVDTGVGIGITAGSTAVGAWIGSLIPIPVVGTLAGAGVGYLVGEGADYLLNTDFECLGNKSVVDWAKDGTAAAADWIVEDLPDIMEDAWEATTNFVEETWDAATDFIEDTGKTIGNFFEDTGENVGNFFKKAGKAIGGFFSGLFA